MDLSEITSALSDAAPYAGAISALANLGIDITKLIDPSQNYDQLYQDRCAKAADLITALVEKPGADSGAAFTVFLNELLATAGRPVVGGIPTTEVSIRVDHLLNLVSGNAELVEYRELFSQLGSANRSGSVQPAAQQVMPKA